MSNLQLYLQDSEHRSITVSGMSRTLGSTHRYKSTCINRSSITCSSHPHQGEVRDPHQRQWWEHQGPRCQTRHLRHRQDYHSCEFLIVENIKNPIIGLDATHDNRLQVHLHEFQQEGKCILQQQHQRKALLHYHQSRYYASGLVLPDHVQSHDLRWSPSVHNLRQSICIQHRC